MALTPLTRVEQATVLALVEARRLDAVPADLARAASFLRQAKERLDQLPLLTSVTVRYGVAYDACHDTGEALLAAYGFRTTNGPGQHEALGRYLRAVFDKPPAEKAAREFDRLRRARNQDRYEAKRRPHQRPLDLTGGPQTVRKKSRGDRSRPTTFRRLDQRPTRLGWCGSPSGGVPRSAHPGRFITSCTTSWDFITTARR